MSAPFMRESLAETCTARGRVHGASFLNSDAYSSSLQPVWIQVASQGQDHGNDHETSRY